MCLAAGAAKQAALAALETQLGSTSASASQSLGVMKYGPDACAWLQVAAKQAALAALETQLSSINPSASQNTKLLT